jgi:hypothetical protein
MSENCHFINVFIPLNVRQGSRKAVMVFSENKLFVRLHWMSNKNTRVMGYDYVV